MQLRHVFSELVLGLRRNVSMHLAVVLTLFVSLTLVGLGLLLNQQADKAADQWGSQLEITAFLCKADDDKPACTGEVTQPQKQQILEVVRESPEVADYRVESKQEAFRKVKEMFGEERFSGPNPPATADAMRQSVWITLKNPEQYEGITSALVGLDGVSQVRDLREVLEPIYGAINALQVAAIATAAFLVLAALMLVANTIRLAALARRKEIGIMRLVGASTLYIALPFLLEALVTALVGVVMAAATLGAVVYFGIQEQLGDQVRIMPWIGMPEYLWSVAVVAVLGPVLTLLPTLVLTRKYLKV